MPSTRSGQHQSRISSPSDYEDRKNETFSFHRYFRVGQNPAEDRHIPRCHLPDASNQRRKTLTDWKVKRDRDRQQNNDIDAIMEKVRAWHFKHVEEKEGAKRTRTKRQSYVQSKYRKTVEIREVQKSALKQGTERLYPPCYEQWNITSKQNVWNRWNGEEWWTWCNEKDREKYNEAVEKLQSGKIMTAA